MMNFSRIGASFPSKSLFIILVIWVVLAVLNFLSLQYWKYTGTDLFFPFSVIYPSAFLWTGFLYSFLFLLSGFLIFQNEKNLSIPVILLLCLVLVFLGNMSQGNLDIAFKQPFYLKGRQYYTDAINITNGSDWLRNFTTNLHDYQLHTVTHPPFITLLHYGILKLVNGSVLSLGIVFFLLSSLFFLVLNKIFDYLGFSLERKKILLLLSAIIPAVNIYLLVSIDGLILATSSLVLLGIARMLSKKKVDFFSFLYCFLGILLTNSITYSGLFLIAFMGIYSLIQIYFKKRFDFLIVLSGSVILSVLVFVIIYFSFGHNYLQAFITASLSENPGGFMLFRNPYVYFCTRLQDVGEILMFLSLGFIAVLFGGKKYKTQLFSDRSINFIFISAIIALSAMFLSGAYTTGETARACLFIVPFFILLLKNIQTETLKIIFFLALLQTFGMQMIANFYW